jgi:hypothetical protein
MLMDIVGGGGEEAEEEGVGLGLGTLGAYAAIRHRSCATSATARIA